MSAILLSSAVNKLPLKRQDKKPAWLPLTPEQLELREMKQKFQRLKMENEILKKSYGSLNVGLTQLFTVVDRLRARYPVPALCRTFEVHPSSYRHWQASADEPDGERVIKRSQVMEALECQRRLRWHPKHRDYRLQGLWRQNRGR